MKPRVRQVIAITLLATALVSDRALAAASSQRIARLPENRNLVTRLTQHLRRVVVGVRIQLVRLERGQAPNEIAIISSVRTPKFRSGLLSVFQLYLPPPVL